MEDFIENIYKVHGTLYDIDKTISSLGLLNYFPDITYYDRYSAIADWLCLMVEAKNLDEG
jgi:hypothetical protein